MTPIHGLHHVTAITANAQANFDFYTRTLGLRLVKRTINYDDPTSYHLYYGDAVGTPGTIMTFFAWPHGRRGTAGTGQVTETSFAVPTGALGWWESHLTAKGVSIQNVTRFGDKGLLFNDPDGLPLALIESADLPRTRDWPNAGIAADHAIRAFHGVTLFETDESKPASVLVNHFGYREAAREQNRIRYLSAAGNAKVVDVVLAKAHNFPRIGAGQVHHVAFRTPTDDEQAKWLETLRANGHSVSPVMDRDYFHSIYFREPGCTLFEIATDTPGFATNEPVETLGEKIALPDWLESQRSAIEAGLPPLDLKSSESILQHVPERS